MTDYAHALQQARLRAEHARRIKLLYLSGHLLAFGRVAPNEIAVAELIVVTEKAERCRYGLTFTPWAVVKEGLARSLGGWVLARVTPRKQLASPTAEDMLLARRRLTDVGFDWTRAPYERSAA